MFLVGFGYVCCSQPTNWRGPGKMMSWCSSPEWSNMGMLDNPYTNMRNTGKRRHRLGHGEQQQDSGQLVHTLQEWFFLWLFSGFTLKLLPWPRPGTTDIYCDMIHRCFFCMEHLPISTLGHTCFWKTGKQCLPIFKVKRRQASCTVSSTDPYQKQRFANEKFSSRVFSYGKTALRIVWLP